MEKWCRFSGVACWLAAKIVRIWRRRVAMSRYVELYGDEHTVWCSARHHRVPLTRMIRWLISNGEEVQA